MNVIENAGLVWCKGSFDSGRYVLKCKGLVDLDVAIGSQ